jgi:dipeptide transport system substrate-binding protein
VKFHSLKDFKPTRDFNADDVLFSVDRQWKPRNPYYKVSGSHFDQLNGLDMPTQQLGQTTLHCDETRRRMSPSSLAWRWTSWRSLEEYADFLLKRTPEQFGQAPVGWYVLVRLL